MAANNSVIVLATKNCCLLRWNLEGTGDPEEIEISRRTEVSRHCSAKQSYAMQCVAVLCYAVLCCLCVMRALLAAG